MKKMRQYITVNTEGYLSFNLKFAASIGLNADTRAQLFEKNNRIYLKIGKEGARPNIVKQSTLRIKNKQMLSCLVSDRTETSFRMEVIETDLTDLFLLKEITEIKRTPKHDKLFVKVDTNLKLISISYKIFKAVDSIDTSVNSVTFRTLNNQIYFVFDKDGDTELINKPSELFIKDPDLYNFLVLKYAPDPIRKIKIDKDGVKFWLSDILQ